MRYSYSRSRALDRDEKSRRRASVLALLCIRLRLPAHTPAWARLLLGRSSGASAFSRLMQQLAAKHEPMDPQLLNWALAYGHPGAVRAIMSSLKDTTLESWAQEVLQQADPDLLLPREHLAPDFQKMQTSSGSPERVLVCFAGNAQRLNMPVQLFHCAVAQHFDLLVYLRDFRRQRFIQGIPGLGADIDELAAALRRHIPSGCHLSVLGTSGGGIAATRVAGILNADRLALFSPAYRFKEVSAIPVDLELDARSVLLFLAAHNSPDRRLGDQWSGTSLGSAIRWLDADSHGTLSYLTKTGRFDEVISWLSGGACPDFSAGFPKQYPVGECREAGPA